MSNLPVSNLHPVKQVKRKLLNNVLVVVLIILLQVAFVVTLLWRLPGDVFAVVYMLLTVLGFFVVVSISSQDSMSPAYREMWTILILGLPPAGTIFFLLWGQRSTRNSHARRYRQCWERGRTALHETSQSAPFALLDRVDKSLLRHSVYLAAQARAPLFADTDCTYYPMGADFFPDYLAALERAEKYIYLQYFIFEPGRMWDSILAVLRRKAASGVDVRILFDYFGCLLTLPSDFEREMRSCGISCKAWAPIRFTPHISDYMMLNHRNHRKVTVIDGEVGFSGGVNLADEYIGERERFGVWKDTAFQLRGQGVYALTVGFLEDWDYVTGEVSDFAAMRPSSHYQYDGFVQPYGDCPMLPENVSENAYFNILDQSERYVYIMTPYLVIDHEMLTSLTLAAKSGVDVRLVVPGIPDKKLVYRVTCSNFPALLKAGVRVFLYTPGFCHAKMYVSDDKIAVVGSANMDYRSLYLHSENCCAFYGGHMVEEVRQDMLDTFALCHELTLTELAREPFPKRALMRLLRVFSPLL